MDIINPKNLRLILKTLSGQKIGEKSTAQSNETMSRAKSFARIPSKTNFQNNVKIQTLNRMEQSILMKELLNLPKDLKELLALLTYKNVSQESVAKLLQSQAITIRPELLKQLLETNSKEVLNKLIKLIQQSPGHTQNFDQLKQVMALIGQAIPSPNASPQEVLTHLLLLYLPWLPLMEQQKIELYFERKKSGGSDDEKTAIVIYISTANLGRFKVTIVIDGKNRLDIDIEHISEEEQTDEKTETNKDILKNILSIINSEIKEDKIEAKTSFSQVKQKKFSDAAKREVTISNVNNVSPIVLVTAQKISRIILEQDEKLSLLQKRKDLCDNAN